MVSRKEKVYVKFGESVKKRLLPSKYKYNKWDYEFERMVYLGIILGSSKWIS